MESINDKKFLTKDENYHKKEIQRMEYEGGVVISPGTIQFTESKTISLRFFCFLKKYLNYYLHRIKLILHRVKK